MRRRDTEESFYRVYEQAAKDGYPPEWHSLYGKTDAGVPTLGIKHYVRSFAGDRCERCKHPYAKGAGQWSRCDEDCRHGGPVRWSNGSEWEHYDGPDETIAQTVEAAWRILTVHHLNMVKLDCRWWNLAALCQRCHLQIQRKVRMEQVWPHEHSEWFKPHAAGYYASVYLGEDLDRHATAKRLDELLALEHTEPRTNRENILRGSGRAADNARKTHCVHGHPLEGENLYLWQRPDGGWNRQCKTCIARACGLIT